MYTQFLSRCVGPTGLVHSFEPSLENFRRLQAATRKLVNVRLSQSAIGEFSCRSTLYVSEKLNVDHRAYLPDGDSYQRVPIEMVALDDYFTPGERVDLLKLDVQGYELHALRGAKRIVNENREIKLLLEFWPYGLKQAGDDWGELIEKLEGFYMNVMFVQADSLIPFEARKVRTDVNWYVNLFASRSTGGAATAR
jgi:FkbM family methyltransferase